jgi:hypothetical protein
LILTSSRPQPPPASAGHARGISAPFTSSSDSSSVATSTGVPPSSLGPGDQTYLPLAQAESREGKTIKPHVQRVDRIASVQPPPKSSTAPLLFTPTISVSSSSRVAPAIARTASSRVPTLRGAEEPHRDTRSGDVLSPFAPTPPGEEKSYPSEPHHADNPPTAVTAAIPTSQSRPVGTTARHKDISDSASPETRSRDRQVSSGRVANIVL